ncbi:MAG TPA: hypothetical protein VN604_12305 [Nitrospirota bacterium]|nr:hypothetical protein [Nitrospirota bacterium]
MTDHRNFAVPKEKQQVKVHLLGGEALAGSIFLEYKPEAVTVYQKVASFLEDRTSFFPIAVGELKPQIVGKTSVKILEIEYPEDESIFSLKRIENVAVMLSDGSRIDGLLMADVPEERDRLSDCLNLPERFLSLRLSGKILFINKALIRKVLYGAKD